MLMSIDLVFCLLIACVGHILTENMGQGSMGFRKAGPALNSGHILATHGVGGYHMGNRGGATSVPGGGENGSFRGARLQAP